MIVCLCNALSESAVRKTAADPCCRNVADIYRRLGCRVQCGKCVPEMRAILREARAAGSSQAGDVPSPGAASCDRAA